MKKTEKIKIKNIFNEYMSNGYSGGNDGLRCDNCDCKYSGNATFNQKCPPCRVIDYIETFYENINTTI